MLQEISYYLIFGKPLIMYLGILVLLCFAATATIAAATTKGWKKLPYEWHPRMAALSFALAAVHAILGILLFF